MTRLNLSSAFSPALRHLFDGTPHRRVRREPWRRASSTRPADSSRRRVRPCLEALEDRITPTTFTPTTLADDGTLNSLRGAITQANADTGTATDTIQLAAGLYTLSIANSGNQHEQKNASGDLNITSTSHGLVIQGMTDAKGNPTTTIQQTAVDRVFQIINGSTHTNITFENLIIEDGQAQEDGGSGPLAGHSDTLGGGILDDGGNVTLTNVVLQKNSAKAVTGNAAAGGGILEEDGGSLTIQSSVIQNNSAIGPPATATNGGGSVGGGGVAAVDATTIINSTLSDNVVIGGSSSSATAGGLAGGGGILAVGPTTITHSTLSGNTVTGGSSSGGEGGSAEGGGVALAPNSQVNATLIACTLSDNTLTGGTGNLSNGENITGDVGGAVQGGGVYANFQTTLAISASILSGNILTGGSGTLNNSSAIISGDVGGEAQGGGVFAQGPTTITTSLLSGNTLSGGNGTYVSGTAPGSIGGPVAGGGAYFSGSDSTASITASTLSGNTLTGGSGSGGSATPGSAQGGGASFAGTNNTLVNATIADNQAIGGLGAPANPVASGGGLFFASTATATLTNVTVADNKASLPPGGTGSTTGGGIDNASGSVILVNSLVALNSATTDTDFAGAVSSSAHDLIGNADGSSGFSTAHGDLFGSTAHPLDPKLGPLQPNGGPTPTIALLPGSPALHAGDPSVQSAIGSNDQRGQGFARVVNGTIDIGAFEVQPPTLTPPPPPGGSSPPKPPPALHTPALLALFDELLHGIETVNGNETEEVIDSLFGISLLVSTYDGAGNLTSVTLFGTNITALFELA